jgi:hypothetical protein
MMLPTKLRIIWPSGYRKEEFFKSANQKQESPVAPCLLTDRDDMSNLYRGPSIEASYQVSGRSDPLTNTNATDNSCFSLVDF